MDLFPDQKNINTQKRAKIKKLREYFPAKPSSSFLFSLFIEMVFASVDGYSVDLLNPL